MFFGELASLRGRRARVLIQITAASMIGATQTGWNTMQYEGVGGLIVLVADVWAIVNIFQSGGSTGDKVLWTVLVLLLPTVRGTKLMTSGETLIAGVLLMSIVT